MSVPKVGRNDPCPCGSGRKYKHCHGAPQAAPADDSHEGAIGRVMAWIEQRHRKAFAEALREQIEDAAIACFDEDEDAALEALDDVPDDLWRQLQINFTEWLIAEGDIVVKGRRERLADLLLGPRGPLLTAAQRDWVEQMARQPLRLYDVTEVRPGEGLMLCDSIDAALPPVFVTEREGSRSLKAGMQLGARLLFVGGEHLLSGALYPFAPIAGQALRDDLRKLAAEDWTHEEDRVLSIGLNIVEAWLAQFLLPPQLPDIVDARSGEPVQLTTDHYELRDWDALEAALRAQPDVEGDAAGGLVRLGDESEDPRRVLASVNPQADRRKVSVFYRTAGLADEGRAWFDALAGESVKHLLREISDPKALLRGGGVQPAGVLPALPEGIDPQALTEAITGMMRRAYANWADEPIPALDGKTPRQAIATPAGLERVKGLLRSYEEGEAEMAQQQGRGPVSYQFLWDALGLSR